MKKNFVLDTNVLLHSSVSIFSFDENVVILPMTVIEELDRFKSRNDELGRNARQVIRSLDSLRRKGRLGEGVSLENGGVLKILSTKADESETCLDLKAPDNQILSVAYALHKMGNKVIFVSKDINARLKADALGIEVMDFEREKINFDELFTGQREISVSGEIVDAFFQQPVLAVEDGDFIFNEFITLVDEANPKHSGMGRAISGKEIVHLSSHFDSVWNIRARSKEQRMAIELLMEPSIKLVTLVGQAGTGKTLLALAAGLETTLHNKQYDKLLVTRPVIPLGKDIGYLPGSKDEKLSAWMQPIFDNLVFLMGSVKSRNEEDSSMHQKVEKLIRNNDLELEALSYIRGRSIPRQYVIVDEAQNLTPHEVKTIISRSGEGTKMVLTGDPYQIDNPYLDSSSNGLTYTVERLKGHSIHGHMTLTKSERSELAGLAAELL